MRYKYSLILLLACLQFACVTSEAPPNTYYYLLDAKPASFPIKETDQKIKVLPVLVPDYLNQPNFVLKLSDHQIKITNYHFWGEDLRQSMQRVLIGDLNKNNATINFTKQCGACAHVLVSLDHFYPTEDGEVVLAGYFEINRQNVTDESSQNKENTLVSFSFKSNLQNGGYDEAAAQMRLLLQQLSERINTSLTE